jgi:hypothetical protein
MPDRLRARDGWHWAATRVSATIVATRYLGGRTFGHTPAAA